jgi:ribosome-binding factor A
MARIKGGRHTPRSDRLADRIHRDLSEIIRTELRDPGFSGLVTLTGVELTSDYRHAKVFFTVLGDEGAEQRITGGLLRASGFLRSRLAEQLTLRVVPELHFVYDRSVESGLRLSQMIDAAVRSDAAREN